MPQRPYTKSAQPFKRQMSDGKLIIRPARAESLNERMNVGRCTNRCCGVDSPINFGDVNYVFHRTVFNWLIKVNLLFTFF